MLSRRARDYRNMHYPDIELKTLIDLQPRVPANERHYHDWQLAHRREIIALGLEHPSVNTHAALGVLRRLQQIDRRLSIWYNADKGGIQIDILVHDYNAHVPLKVVPVGAFDMALVAEFIEADMQRPGNSGPERAERKRANAIVIQERNEVASNDRLRGVIDNMSNTQVKKFVEVEKAIQTGETVTMHGDDRRFYDKALANTQKVEGEGGKVTDDEAMVQNPGAHPKLHQHKSLGQRGKESLT